MWSANKLEHFLKIEIQITESSTVERQWKIKSKVLRAHEDKWLEFFVTCFLSSGDFNLPSKLQAINHWWTESHVADRFFSVFFVWRETDRAALEQHKSIWDEHEREPQASITDSRLFPFLYTSWLDYFESLFHAFKFDSNLADHVACPTANAPLSVRVQIIQFIKWFSWCKKCVSRCESWHFH